MEYLVAVAFTIVPFVIGRQFGSSGRDQLMHAIEKTERDRIDAETRYLEEIRRGLAQALMSEYPQALVDAHAAVAHFILSMRDGGKERMNAEYRALSLKYPNFIDFDLFGLKHYVPNDTQGYDKREIIERYIDIGKFMTVLAQGVNAPMMWTDERLTHDRDILKRTVQWLEDSALIEKMEEAMGRYYAWSQHDDAKGAFEDRDYRVEQLASFTPEVEYGVTLKGDGTRGIYAFYVFEEDTYRISHRYNLADEHFNIIRRLDGRSSLRSRSCAL